MNIAFDISGIPAFRGGGIDMFVRNAFSTIIKQYPEHQFYPVDFFGEPAVYSEFTGDNVKPICYFSGKNGYLRQYKGQSTQILGSIIRNFLMQSNVDVFVVTAPFLETSDIGYNAIYQQEWFKGVKVVSILYDVIPFIYKDQYLRDRVRYQWYMTCVDMLRWNDGIIAISNSAKEDFYTHFKVSKDMIDVAYLGASTRFRIIDDYDKIREVLENKFGIHVPFILCSNSADWRKNSESAIKAYCKLPQKLRDTYQLVVVGRTSDEIRRKYEKSMNKGNHIQVVFTGFVSDEELVELYNLATLMIFPSLYEGFGLPMVEAWKCGTPVISSNNSSLGELNFMDDLTFDPNSVDSIAKCLEYTLTEADLNDVTNKCIKQAEKFTWENTADGMMDAINKFCENSNEQNMNLGTIFVFEECDNLPNSWKKMFSELAKKMNITLVASEKIESWNESISVIGHKQFASKGMRDNEIIYCVTDYVSDLMLQTMKKHTGKWLVLDETLDEMVENLFGDCANHADFALRTKLSNYFCSSVYTVLDCQNIDESIQGIILSGVKNKQLFGDVCLNVPVYNIAPADKVVSNDNQKLVDAFLTNLMVACTQVQIITDRKKAQRMLEKEITNNAYTKQEARAFAKTIANAFSTDPCMEKIQITGNEEDKNAIKIAMVSSWNTKCGIAEFTKYYCDALGNRVNYTVYPNRSNALLGPEDEHTASRVWNFHSDVSRLADALLKDPSHIVHVQYTEGFFTTEGLCELAEKVTAQKAMIVTCHNTKYLKCTSKSQRSALNNCKFIVHQDIDRDNLVKQGILDENIFNIYHGQLQAIEHDCKDVRKQLGIENAPIIGSYGFLLSHKGIAKVIQAVAQLKKKYPDILYIACCSLFNADVSHHYYKECVDLVEKLGLQNNVKLITDFLKPSESTYILQACDALAMVYDDTGESASGAVRFCIATKRPLITTKYNIFKEFADCTLQIQDNKPENIAKGIDNLLSDKDMAQKYSALIEKKIEQTSWETVTKQYLEHYHELLD